MALILFIVSLYLLIGTEHSVCGALTLIAAVTWPSQA